MNNFAETRAVYLAKPLPKRLGALAVNLAHISDCARQETPLDELMLESMYFIEWTAAELEPEVAYELVEMQLMLSLWRKIRAEGQGIPSQRTLLYLQAPKWSAQVLDYSGLLENA
ncbi:MAG: hypothetical protein JNL09_02765 [Anaerolineales bacterium]|nr:hypothetical protein [Anaerolineales bacterium]